MMNKKNILLLLVIIVAIIVSTWLYFNFRYDFISNNYPVKGIDISHHQKKIDWNAIKENKDISFIIIKATEGEDWQDSIFQKNWDNAKNNGYIVGAYHFFKHTSTGLNQAANYIKMVPIIDSSLPPIVDLEDMKAEPKNPNAPIINPEICKKELKDFLKVVEAHYGKKPIIYTNYSQYNYYLLNDFKDNPIWMYDFKREPDLSDKRKWTFWQYTQNGRCAGINGPVDLNCFRGSREDLISLTKTKK